MLGSLKDFISSLETGDSGLSLRVRLARLANARSTFDPLAAAVRAGDSVNYDDFTAAAQTVK